MAQGKCVMNESDRIVNSYADSDVINSAEPFASFAEFAAELEKVRNDVSNVYHLFGYRESVIRRIDMILSESAYDVNTELHLLEEDMEKLSMQCGGTRYGFYMRKAEIGIKRIITRYNSEV